jgi:hypothetical protein
VIQPKLRGTLSTVRSCVAFSVILFASCSGDGDPEDPPVARAFDERLFWSDLRQVVPMDASPEDSAALAQRYIVNWLRQRVVIEKAEQNLGAAQKDFEAQLREYRNSLVIFAYEQALVDQKLDTVVTRAEIEDYYEGNRENFELQDNILRVRWFKVKEQEKRDLKRLEGHFLSGSADRMREVELWLAQRGIPIVDRSGSWTTFGELRAEIPVWNEDDGRTPLSEGRKVFRDEFGAYFVDVLELRSKASVSPLPMVQQDIRTIMINQRKLQLVERMREDLFREAETNKDVEVY